MADNDDDGFDLIQPSLIQQLRTILDQYPDDGQILKVRVLTIGTYSLQHVQSQTTELLVSLPKLRRTKP